MRIGIVKPRLLLATALMAGAAAAGVGTLMMAPAASVAADAAAAAAPGKFQLEKGEHICVIGNTLAERMQHTGWLESLVHARHPGHELVVRNLGFSGDEIPLSRNIRSEKFGTPTEWLSATAPPAHKGAQPVAENRFALTNTKADVIFAFFGYNESYAGEKGLGQFQSDLTNTLKELQGQKFNGKSAPRIVLFSPTAFENLKDPDFPNGEEQNKNLKLYTNAMAEVAKANNVTFVDLFTPTLAAYGKGDKPWTINGVHLNDHGYRQLALIVDAALFGESGRPELGQLDKLRQAVNEKNWHWFHRYRVTDGFSNFGGRGGLAFVNNQTNYEVLQRESEILDVMTANRDRRIWAAAQGKDAPPADDGNTPAFIPVETNKPGTGPNGAHVFLGAEEAIGKMKVGQGMKVNLFASEEQFPELVNPVQMAFDTKGRLWVAAWPTYPHWTPKQPMNDKLLILEDTNGDGKADKSTAFADNLHNPTGFEFYNGGVIVAMAPDLVFLKDTDGDDKADVFERILHGLDTADTHHTANSFTFDPGGALYFQEGTFHHTQVESPWAPTERVANGAVFRFEPRTGKFDVYTSYGFANPHGHVFDAWGNDIIIDGTGAVPYFGPSFTGRIYYPNKHNGNAPTVYRQRTRPCPAAEILTSRHFPDDMQGNFLVPNVIGFQGVLNYKLEEKGSGLAGTEVQPIVESSDPNFRPADIEVGPDGAIYFTDWHNPIIGHMQHNLRDPSRDKAHGRVYRVTYEGRPLLEAPKIAGEPVEKLLDLLKSPENRVRYLAKIELSGRKTDEVIAGVKKWVGGLDKNDKNYEHQMAEALWVHQWHNVVDQELLNRQLKSPDHRARAAAVRVLTYWRDRVPNALELVKQAANDQHPRVRLEAVRACSFFQTPEAAEAALESVNHPQDEFLKYTLDETMRTLEPFTK